VEPVEESPHSPQPRACPSRLGLPLDEIPCRNAPLKKTFRLPEGRSPSGTSEDCSVGGVNRLEAHRQNGVTPTFMSHSSVPEVDSHKESSEFKA
jgi:hypothetical protein